ncbi:serine protease inhibitor dipetalogastin [Daphnia magna]|uniref:Kazal-like domain-containing protein n=1 Tax=Daphnia magna TaxID=35525 RepID=A0ABQ9ZYU4_9CRUS|nr:serine protease inhibitor dipetalogastin [Daphnia magna]KAK4018080.1 hypothetical protein OUZ56_000149 [Daphnia magna]
MRCTTLLLVMLVGTTTSCQIPKNGKPICGTNGVSYVDIKALQCYNKANRSNMIRIAYRGRCLRPEIPQCNFSATAKNVCGNDGLTYLNSAMVACKNKLQPNKQVKIIGKGPCKKNSRRRKGPKNLSTTSNRRMNAE